MLLQNNMRYYQSGIDIVTPWLVISILLYPGLQICFLGVLSGFLLEVHNNLIKTYFISLYWSLLGVLLIARSKIVLQNYLSWVIVLLLAQIWILFFDFCVFFSRDSLIQFFSQKYLICFFMRITISIASVTLCKNKIQHLLHSEK